MTRTSNDLGTFRVTQNPLGIAVQASAQSNCVGSYDLTLTLPDQTLVKPNGQLDVLIGTQATGTLHVGGPFTETDTYALARPGRRATFAALVRNSVAGPGAGELRRAKTTNSSATLKGTDYYACGTVDVEATVRYASTTV